MSSTTLHYVILTLLQVSIVSSFVSSTPCPDGWLRRLNSCYLFETVPEPWHEALGYCIGLNSHLLATETEAEFDFIAAQLHKIGGGNLSPFWTGGTDVKQEGTWIWSKTGQRVSILRWHPGEPNSDGDEDCLTIKPLAGVYLFNDKGCGSRFKFVCEMDEVHEGGR